MFGSWKNRLSPQQFSKHEDVYAAAHECKETENPQSCIEIAYALVYAPMMERNPVLSRAILTQLCSEQHYAPACRLLGDMVTDITRPKIEDPVQESLAAYNAGCTVGDPIACRLFAEKVAENDLRGANHTLILRYNTAAFQMSENLLKHVPENDLDQTAVQRLPKGPRHYPIPTRSLDEVADLHHNMFK